MFVRWKPREAKTQQRMFLPLELDEEPPWPLSFRSSCFPPADDYRSFALNTYRSQGGDLTWEHLGATRMALDAWNNYERLYHATQDDPAYFITPYSSTR
jgi:hypothetical protein